MTNPVSEGENIELVSEANNNVSSAGVAEALSEFIIGEPESPDLDIQGSVCYTVHSPLFQEDCRDWHGSLSDMREIQCQERS